MRKSKEDWRKNCWEGIGVHVLPVVLTERQWVIHDAGIGTKCFCLFVCTIPISTCYKVWRPRWQVFPLDMEQNVEYANSLESVRAGHGGVKRGNTDTSWYNVRGWNVNRTLYIQNISIWCRRGEIDSWNVNGMVVWWYGGMEEERKEERNFQSILKVPGTYCSSRCRPLRSLISWLEAPAFSSS